MKYVIIADLHVQYKGHALTIDNKPEYIFVPLNNLVKAAEYAKANNAELIIAGDLVEEKTRIHSMVLNSLLETLYYIKELVPVYIINGNHDYVTINDQYISFLDILSRDFNVVPPGGNESIGDTLLISHGKKEEIVNAFIDNSISDKKLIVSHFGLQEAITGKIRGLGEFSIKDFSELQSFLVLGHYHKPQEVTKNILYVGSPYIVRFDEIDDDKRFILFDTDTLTYESIPTDYPKYKKVKLDSTSTVDKKTIIQDIEENLNKYVIQIPPDYLHKGELNELKYMYPGYIIVQTAVDKQDSQSSDDLNINIKSMSVKNIFSSYLLKKGIPADKHSMYIEAVQDLI